MCSFPHVLVWRVFWRQSTDIKHRIYFSPQQSAMGWYDAMADAPFSNALTPVWHTHTDTHKLSWGWLSSAWCSLSDFEKGFIFFKGSDQRWWLYKSMLQTAQIMCCKCTQTWTGIVRALVTVHRVEKCIRTQHNSVWTVKLVWWRKTEGVFVHSYLITAYNLIRVRTGG